jgi:DNA-directed RNA polymerase specialized sigma24 family protein
MESWAAELASGRADAAWDLFLDRYRRLIFAAIRHYAQDYDDVMDIFARVCEALREDDLARLRCYAEQPFHGARFSTWLVTVVRHLTIDWFRHRNGRRRLSTLADGLPSLRRRIFELVYFERRSTIEAYELIRAHDAPDLPFGRFLSELGETHKAVTAGRRGRVLRELGPPPSPEPARPITGATAERRDRLQHALESLGTEDRRAVELYVMEGRPAGEVARLLDMPNTKALYNRVYRVLGVLRARFEQAGIGAGDL